MKSNPLRLLLMVLMLGLPVKPGLAQPVASPAILSEPGWSAWRPRAEFAAAQFSSGFSNSELGGFMDFEAICQQSIGLPNEEIDYWFRLSRLVTAIGTGRVEYGCWQTGEFVHTFSSTAVRTDLSEVNCLKVNTNASSGLVIRSEPSSRSAWLGGVRVGGRVTPSSFPAVILNAEGRDWIAISNPREGWVSVGESPVGPINLSLCNS